MSPIFSPDELTISEMILRLSGDTIDFEDTIEVRDVAGSAADGLRWSRQTGRLVAAQRQFWIIDASARISSGPISVAVNIAVPALSAADIAQMELFVAQFDAMQPAIGTALEKALQAPDSRALSNLIHDLHAGLDPRYWVRLFGRSTQPGSVTAKDILAACTCVALHFNLPGVPHNYIGGTHEAQFDFRFLVDHLIEGDEQAENYLRFGTRYDVTDQIIVVRTSLDRGILDIRIDS